MKKPILILAAAAVLGGCTDAQLASYSALGDEATIRCYSDAQIIFEDTSTGRVSQIRGAGITFKSKTTGKYVRAYADCIVTN